MSHWTRVSDKVLHDVFAALPADATEHDVRKAMAAAYPFGERAMWPYKAWLAACKRWLDAWKKGYRITADQPAVVQSDLFSPPAGTER